MGQTSIDACRGIADPPRPLARTPGGRASKADGDGVVGSNRRCRPLVATSAFVVSRTREGQDEDRLGTSYGSIGRTHFC